MKSSKSVTNISTVVPGKAKRRLAGILVILGLAGVLAGAVWVRSSPGMLRALSARTDPDVLLGKWVRPDGGYVLDIRHVAGDGTVDVGYFNPRPIRVARAQMTLVTNAISLFVELRDVNYPGATYRLTYRPQQDQLAGLYHQPLVGQTFEVAFQRGTP